MTPLDAAWAWYASVKAGCRTLEAVGRTWERVPWDGVGPLPERLRTATPQTFAALAGATEQPLDDLAVLVLFSAFEAVVRDAVRTQLAPLTSGWSHPLLARARDELHEAIDEGSFAGVLKSFKSSEQSDLVEQVNQVRRYRNWVAHGRRPSQRPAANVKPRDAYERLKRFLDEIVSLNPES